MTVINTNVNALYTQTAIKTANKTMVGAANEIDSTASFASVQASAFNASSGTTPPAVTLAGDLGINSAANGSGGLKAYSPNDVQNFIDWQNATIHSGTDPSAAVSFAGNAGSFDPKDPKTIALAMGSMDLEARRAAVNPDYRPEYLTDWKTTIAQKQSVNAQRNAIQLAERVADIAASKTVAAVGGGTATALLTRLSNSSG